MDTNLTSEKSSLYKFLSLYIFLTIIIFLLASTMYYKFEKEVMLYSKLPKLQEYSKDVIRRIRAMHNSLLEDNYYPRYSNFKSAIYDADYVKIFSLLRNEKIDFQNYLYKRDRYIYFIKEPSLYYLGAKYVVIEVLDDEKWLTRVYKNILIYGGIFIVFMAIIGYFLGKQFLRPMKESFMLLNNFIKDTTHELNTPVSTILTNIETIDKESLPAKLQKKIERIEIAARTISVIYKDLAYLLLQDKIPSTIEKIDMNELIGQRVDYFKTMAEAKKIKISFSKSPCFLQADKQKISRLIDNILSNAIKYNKIGGTIKIKTFKNGFYIEDSGIGIEQSKIDEIFERYRRLSSSEGGFGIGLNIVLAIAKEFNLQIKVDSKINQYTRISILWQE